MAIPRPEGTNKSSPSSTASCLMARDSAAGEMCNSSDARRRLPVSATTAKYLSLIIFIVAFSLTINDYNLLFFNKRRKYNLSTGRKVVAGDGAAWDRDVELVSFAVLAAP